MKLSKPIYGGWQYELTANHHLCPRWRTKDGCWVAEFHRIDGFPYQNAVVLVQPELPPDDQ
jgi:hypothetical protein